MSDYSNPYRSPETQIIPENPKGAAITELMLRYLQGASPWLRFMGIIGYIGFSLICLIGVIFFFVSLSTPAIAFTILILYSLIALLVFFPARFSFNFGKYIRSYLYSQDANDLETALSNNKSYWKFTGILTIIYLSLIVTVILLSIIRITAAGGSLNEIFNGLNNLNNYY